MQGEIICIGDELLSGRVADTNSRYLASRLYPLGIALSRVVQVGDVPGAIKQALTRALGRAEFLVVTGGLGTTSDDITAQMAAEVFELPLAESRRMVANLRAVFAERGREFPEEAMRLAWMPRGAELLCATCAGFRLTGPQGQPVYFLPGVPEEMRQITDQKVVPELAARQGGGRAVVTREIRLFGLPESKVGKMLEGLEGGDIRLGFYPVFPEVEVTVTAWAGDAPEAERAAQEVVGEVARRLGDNVFTTTGQLLEEVVGGLMLRKALTIALAESCTGGLIGHRLTGVAGSSGYFERGMVVYSNRAKEEMLGVSHATLEAHGAVSQETAREMAQGARRRAGTDLGLAVTGIAGPGGGTSEKPVGTVWFGLAHGEEVWTHHRRFHGERDQIKALSAETALDILRRHLEGHAPVHRP